MRIELRGVIAAGLGRSAIELTVPAEGIAVSELLRVATSTEPRLERYLEMREVGQLRTIVNGTVLAAGDDPMVHDSDRIMLLTAVVGG